MTTLSNQEMSIQVARQGAELHSIQCNGKEYLWQADPAIWNRHAPVLFPIVGKVWDGTYRMNERTYELGQHGFARDMMFELIYQSENEVRFQLIDNARTREVYPCFFCLQIGYRLEGKKLQVTWKVINTDPKEIYFQIGAHPGFYYQDFNVADEVHGYMGFGEVEALDTIRISEKGCADTEHHYPIALTDGLLPLTDGVFAHNALIMEDCQVTEATLYNKEKHPYLKMTFDAPVLGVWSPDGKQAPFDCIEPWYGRCDRAGFEGEFKEKDWVMRLMPGEAFETSYTIEIIDNC